MTRRIRSAEESARRERKLARNASYTLIADSSAPRDPRFRGDHYRRHLADAHRTIEVLQGRITEVEQQLAKVRADKAYQLSLTVSRTVAISACINAFRLAREKAARLMEGPDSEPTSRSEAIRDIPDIRPKWSNR